MASLKTEFNQFAKNRYLKLDYKAIYKRLRNILRNSINQEEDVKGYVYTLMESIVQQNIVFKNRIPTPKELAKRRNTCPKAIDACIDSISFLKRMCTEINPSFKVSEHFGLKQEDFTSIIHTEVDKTNISDSVLEYIQKEPYDLLLGDINHLVDDVPENALYKDLKSDMKEKLQDIYMKKEMAIQQMSTRSKFWKFFCRRAVKNYNEFVEKTENLLR